MKIVKATGLAPVLLLAAVGNNQAGETCGFPPEIAAGLLLGGHAQEVTVPQSIETEDIETEWDLRKASPAEQPVAQQVLPASPVAAPAPFQAQADGPKADAPKKTAAPFKSKG